MSLLSAIIKLASPAPQIEDFESFMFVGPHPDDIEIGAGATAAKLVAEGKKVCFVVCIDGRFGDSNNKDLSPEELVEIRKKEAIASAKMLGVTDLHFLGLCDGGFYDTEELKRLLAAKIGEFRPEVIFAPDPCVKSECHTDHLNVGEAVRRLACFAPYAGIMAKWGAGAAPVKALAYYMTAKPNRFVGTKGYLGRQLESIFSCHKSQFPDGCDDARSISLYLRLRAYDFGLRSLKGCAEGFRVLGVTQMHCLPEAD